MSCQEHKIWQTFHWLELHIVKYPWEYDNVPNGGTESWMHWSLGLRLRFYGQLQWFWKWTQMPNSKKEEARTASCGLWTIQPVQHICFRQSWTETNFQCFWLPVWNYFSYADASSKFSHFWWHSSGINVLCWQLCTPKKRNGLLWPFIELMLFNRIYSGHICIADSGPQPTILFEPERIISSKLFNISSCYNNAHPLFDYNVAFVYYKRLHFQMQPSDVAHSSALQFTTLTPCKQFPSESDVSLHSPASICNHQLNGMGNGHNPGTEMVVTVWNCKAHKKWEWQVLPIEQLLSTVMEMT